MTFLDFFIYTTVSNLIYTVLFFGFNYLKNRHYQKKLEQMIKSGQIKMVSLEDLIPEHGPEDKKQWN